MAGEPGLLKDERGRGTKVPVDGGLIRWTPWWTVGRARPERRPGCGSW